MKLIFLPEVIERLDKSLISFDKSVTLSFRKSPDRLLVLASFESWVALRIVRIEFSETDAKWK